LQTFIERFVYLLSKRLNIIARLDASDDVCHLYSHGKSFSFCSFQPSVKKTSGNFPVSCRKSLAQLRNMHFVFAQAWCRWR